MFEKPEQYRVSDLPPAEQEKCRRAIREFMSGNRAIKFSELPPKRQKAYIKNVVISELDSYWRASVMNHVLSDDRTHYLSMSEYLGTEDGRKKYDEIYDKVSSELYGSCSDCPADE